MVAAAKDPLEHVRTIYQAAREVSHETRAELAGDFRGGCYTDPARKWRQVLAGRDERGVAKLVNRAGKQVTAEAGAGPLGRAVRLAVRNLVKAVADLTAFVPEYERIERYEEYLEEWVTVHVPTEASAARLDGLRQAVFVKLVELDELLRDHPDPLARVVAVAKRIAVKLLPTAEAARVGRWFERMEQDAG